MDQKPMDQKAMNQKAMDQKELTTFFFISDKIKRFELMH